MTDDLSLIVATYNQPNALGLVLRGYARQTCSDFNIIVADDGSGSETADVLDRARRELGLRIEHVWHQDDGFRKCRILNLAILQSTADYLIFTDGDCIPRRDFVEAHLAFRRRGCYLSGGYIKLNGSASAAIDAAAVDSGDFCDRRWLVAQGYPRLKNLNKLLARGRMATFLNRVSRTRPGWHGHNASCWRSDALAVNGFDERMGWGGEDLEFGYRLVNAGVDPIRIRYHAICVHLDHPRPWRDEQIVARNKAMRLDTLRHGRTQTTHGISEMAKSQP